MTPTDPKRSVVLVVLDGWGYSATYEGNAIAQANTPVFDRLWKESPHTLLQASGEAVGLPWGEMGNSEVGHLNLGAGREVPQDLPRISAAISDESFFSNEALVAAAKHVKQTGGTLHLIGIASTGGVHGHLRHLVALLELAKRQGVSKVAIHMFTDGRDSPPKAALGYVKKLEEEIAAHGVGRIASVSGRYYAMDRDNRWDRTKLAFEAIAAAKGPTATTAKAAIEQAYADEFTDEFIRPTVIADPQHPAEPIKETDAVIVSNFRPDRIRQLTEALARSDFSRFDRAGLMPTGVHFVTMTQYEPTLPVHVAFHPLNVPDSLPKVLSDAGVRQFHIAETEKYPHVTSFFNGGIEDPFPLEERLLIPSPQVATYDQQPAMSAEAITDELTKRMEAGDFPFIVANYANPDMVGHTGSQEATIKAVEVVDRCLGRVVESATAAGSFLMITADHGNADQMIDFTTGEPDTEHSTNPVPFILVVPKAERQAFNYNSAKLTLEPTATPTGLLGDVAPSILKILGLKAPEAMLGFGLL
jgi:2,3-bisphosphoglycerate-independent phosphoglycerate mutase